VVQRQLIDRPLFDVARLAAPAHLFLGRAPRALAPRTRRQASRHRRQPGAQRQVGRRRGTSIDRGSASVLRNVGSDLGVAHQGAGQAMHPIGIVEAEVAGSVGGVHGDELDRVVKV
jgi:hypothetical protein